MWLPRGIVDSVNVPEPMTTGRARYLTSLSVGKSGVLQIDWQHPLSVQYIVHRNPRPNYARMLLIIMRYIQSELWARKPETHRLQHPHKIFPQKAQQRKAEIPRLRITYTSARCSGKVGSSNTNSSFLCNVLSSLFYSSPQCRSFTLITV